MGNLKSISFVILIVLSQSCKKFHQVDLPIDKTSAQYIFRDSKAAVSAMTGIYAELSMDRASNFVGDGGISIQAGLYADELDVNSNIFFREYQNRFESFDDGFDKGAWLRQWDFPYRKTIFRINSVIEGVNSSTQLPIKIQKILLGEAKFLRALVYFYLVNFFGDVPIVTTTDFKTNSNLKRATKDEVYSLILSDLLFAKDNLPHQYLSGDLTLETIERLRPTSAVASALLSRVYLFTHKWASAESESTRVINNNLFMLEPISMVFDKHSKEAIWQLQPNTSSSEGGPNTPDGKAYLRLDGETSSFALSSDLLQSFESNDARLSWITRISSASKTYHVPFKYKSGMGVIEQKEYTTVLRLAEQYLIRSEARAHLGFIEGSNSSESDINILRRRANLQELNLQSLEECLIAINQERKIELFAEFGHRWFDLKRTGDIDNIMINVSKNKGTIWSAFKAYLPIPYSEFLRNPGLKGQQNTGYTEP